MYHEGQCLVNSVSYVKCTAKPTVALFFQPDDGLFIFIYMYSFCKSGHNRKDSIMQQNLSVLICSSKIRTRTLVQLCRSDLPV